MFVCKDSSGVKKRAKIEWQRIFKNIASARFGASSNDRGKRARRREREEQSGIRYSYRLQNPASSDVFSLEGVHVDGTFALGLKTV